MSKTHWKQLVNMDYLGAYALPDGNDLTLTIAKVAKELVTGNSGRKEQCMVVHFKEQNYKPMILNRTNAKSIQALVGSAFVEDREGHKITLYASTTRFGGDVVECLRIRPTVTEQTTKYFCENCGQEIKGSASFTAEQIIAGSMKKFGGKRYCMDCCLKQKEKADTEKKE